jgi:hypothetical protein
MQSNWQTHERVLGYTMNDICPLPSHNLSMIDENHETDFAYTAGPKANSQTTIKISEKQNPKMFFPSKARFGVFEPSTEHQWPHRCELIFIDAAILIDVEMCDELPSTSFIITSCWDYGIY